MRPHRRHDDLYLGKRYIAESEKRVERQKQLINGLKKLGRPTREAESVLQTFEVRLLKLRNHLDVMKELTKPD